MKAIQALLLSLTLLLISTSFGFAQNWKALNPPMNVFNGAIYATLTDDSGNVYAGGDFKNSSNNCFVAKWNGLSWNELGLGTASLNANSTIFSMLKGLDGSIYAAGNFINSSGFNYVARWTGDKWTELGTGAAALNVHGTIYSIATDKYGNLYAAGSFSNAAGKYFVAKWNGTTWSELGTGVNALNANRMIYAVTADSSGNIFAGGYFTNALGKAYVAKWNGSSWSEAGSGANVLNVSGYITCLAADNNGNVYAGGDFVNSNAKYYMAKWNGSTWSEMGSGNNALEANDRIKAIAIKSATEIYVAGYFTNSYGNYVAKWNGSSWLQVNNAATALMANDAIYSIQVDANNNIFAAGKFTNKSKNQYVAKWNGTGWSEPGNKGEPFVSSQSIYKIVADSANNVYVSGNFSDGGANYRIAHWNGSSWNELYPDYMAGMSIYDAKNNMAIDKAGNVYAGGYFNDGNTSYKCILKWDGNKWSKLEDYPNALRPYGTVSITDIQTDNKGNVYVSGSFNDSIVGLCSLAKWDGKKWTRLRGSATSYISNFCVAGDGNIYALNFYDYGSGKYYIGRYNESIPNWQEVRNPDSSRFTAVGANVFMSLTTDKQNNLYVNGFLTDATDKRYLAKWDGKNWSKFGFTNNLGINLAVDSSGNVYTEGSAGLAGNCAVIKWNGASWVGVGCSLTQQDVSPLGTMLTTDPNGNVYSNANQPSTSGNYVIIAKFGSAGIQPPKILSFKPASGSLGSKITITGNHFTGATAVNFGGLPASSFSVNNDSTITAYVGNGSTGAVAIQTLAGSDSLQKFTYTCDSIIGPVPTISSTGDTILLSTNANYYQWYLNNKKIGNEISRSLHISKTGFYHVETSSNKQCWVSSLDYPVIVSSAPLSDTLKVRLYPNPSNGKFTVDVKLPQTTSVTAYLKVIDLNGVDVLQTNRLIFFGDEVRIPVTLNTKGTYIVKVFVNGDSRQQIVVII